MTNQNTEIKFIQIITDIIKYEVAGYENAVQDGDMSQEEFNESTTVEALKDIANYHLSDAYKRGVLESPLDIKSMEAKHIKFLGTENIDAYTEGAVYIARIQCKIK